ncbi:hypothetical protein ACI2I2_19770 [Scandinavium sp. NPDC088450]|uniref:hypothetical protein n=1 Tax=Scandinavium sp. NPDC088450 TaxID=3364514 RepID=UPI00384DFDDC
MKFFSSFFFGLSVLCFCSALYFPSFSTDTGSSDGLALLITGGFGFFVDPGASFSWLANPFYIASLIGVIRGKENNLLFILSLVSFLLAISFLGVKSIIIDTGGRERPVISYGLGFWMWISAPFIMMVGHYIEIKRCEILSER